MSTQDLPLPAFFHSASFHQDALPGLAPIQHTDRSIPGSVHYTVTRFPKTHGHRFEDMAFLRYECTPADQTEPYLMLRFCVAGNAYCTEKQTDCDQCRLAATPHCLERVPTTDLITLSFTPQYLRPFVRNVSSPDALAARVLRFEHTASFSQTNVIDQRLRTAIEQLLNHTYTDLSANIFVNAQLQIMLLYTLELFWGSLNTDSTFSRFLQSEEERGKIIKAREILLEHIGNPITIKALSRKVAINECYLKTGFKEIFGTTIFDFYQSQRMEHAKFLLCDKRQSVTDVSALLGYSSISHFSTAFKKHTGMKPCELFLHQ